MSASGLEIFDKTLQTTHIWLNEVMDEIGPDRQVAWNGLGAVLRALRDRIPLELAAHLGAELPLLVRGAYYDQWRPAIQPERYRSLDEFLARVADHLGTGRLVDQHDLSRAVFSTLTRHLSEGQIRKVKEALPEEIRAIWPQSGSEQDVNRVEVDREDERSARRG